MVKWHNYRCGKVSCVSYFIHLISLLVCVCFFFHSVSCVGLLAFFTSKWTGLLYYTIVIHREDWKWIEVYFLSLSQRRRLLYACLCVELPFFQRKTIGFVSFSVGLLSRVYWLFSTLKRPEIFTRKKTKAQNFVTRCRFFFYFPRETPSPKR